MPEIGQIGPNAILQLLPVILARGTPSTAARILSRANLSTVPDGTEMIPETEAAHLHQAVRAVAPGEARAWTAEAGRRTADYILTHRIPMPAQVLLKALPPFLAARALARAIAQNAWTFAGSGEFEVVGPWRFKITANPIVSGEVSPTPLCRWHEAVFERLYRVLIAPDCVCRELECCAQPGTSACVFQIDRG